MKRLFVVLVVLHGLICLPNIARAINCSGLPTSFDGDEFPTGTFFSNFNNACYTIALQESNGHQLSGDLNSIYDRIAFRVDPRYQLIVVGKFPNARYLSVTVYDDHGAISQSILDTNIAPLTARYVNPFQPGVPFVPGQEYAVPVTFGGTPGTLQNGCKMIGYNVQVNGMDATQRHPGMNWNTDSEVFTILPQFPLHELDTPQHSNPNPGGELMVRTDLQVSSTRPDDQPHIIVRDVASGCAYPAAYALQSLNVVSTTESWMNQNQISAHRRYSDNYLQPLCFAQDPQNKVFWQRGTEYISGINPNAAYVSAKISAGLPAQLAAAGLVMRVRLRIPVTPPTPCGNGCSRSGTEQIRYMSLSLQTSKTTLASLADNAFTQDSNGYATLIVGTGASIPSWITAKNGYTFLDLTAAPDYTQLNSLFLREVLPSPGFSCAGQAIPYDTREATPAGGLMGVYLPVVDFPSASTLPHTATPLTGSDSCSIFPSGNPSVLPSCAVQPFPALQITSVTTQCPAPGCNQVVVQHTLPLTIVGDGFGNFPGGLPFAGNSNYLEITDNTAGWSAGYGSDLCDVSIDNWSNKSISLVANVNQGGKCLMTAGDNLSIQVCNPQTMAQAALSVTVAAQ